MYRSAGTALTRATSCQTGARRASSCSVGAVAPNSGVSTSACTGRRNKSTAAAT